MAQKRGRFLIVWWGLTWQGWSWGFLEFDGAWGRVYRWWLQLGPLEIRRWAASADED